MSLFRISLILLLVLALPVSLGKDCHYAFNSLEDQYRTARIRLKHGECAIATDFTHFIRAGNSERCKIKEGEGK